MTGRSRRNNMVHLQVRGLSRVPLDEHPPLEHAEDFAFQYYHTDEDSSYAVNATSGQVSLSNDDQDFMDGSNWTTGNTTERSSVDSLCFWGNDEFEKKATREIEQLFEQIDSVLYEQSNEGPQHLCKECQEWVSQFPHLRLLGTQLLPPQEKGFDEFPRDFSRPSTGSTLEEIVDPGLLVMPCSQQLSVTGKVAISKYANDQPDIDEEIIEQDGYVEEVLAVDYNERLEETGKHKHQLNPRRQRTGYPPITPLACVRDSIISITFDYLWTEVIGWLRSLLKQYALSVLLEDTKPASVATQPILFPQPRNEMVGMLLSRETSSMNSIPKVPLLSRNPSILSSMMKNPQSLEGILTVKPKDLIDRSGSIFHDPSETHSSSANQPGLKGMRPGSVRTSQRTGKIRLMPLASDISKPPAGEEERNFQSARGVLLVTKLRPTYTEQLLSPTSLGPRNEPLPPINVPEVLDVQAPRIMHRLHMPTRVSSAMGDKDLRVPIRERSSVSPAESRPSTTHAILRSEMPHGAGGSAIRRSSTPQGTNSILGRSHALGIQNVTLGISGSGIQPPGDNLTQDIVEADESLPDDMVHSHWTPATPSNNPYRRGRQLSSIVKS